MMKKLLYILCFLSTVIVSAQCTGTFNVFTESFETNGNTVNGGDARYSSINDFKDTSNDYWGRVSAGQYYLDSTPLGIISTWTNYTGANGNFYYAGEDLDDAVASSGNADGLAEKSITFSGINIANATNLCFSGLFAVGNVNSCGSSAYDSADYIRVFYSVDGGAEVKALQFSPNNCASTNSTLHYDPNMDGNGADGAILTNIFSEFSFSIPTTGNTLTLRLEAHMNAASEEIAFDYFRVQSDTMTLGTDSFQLEEPVSIFPNPTSGVVNIKTASNVVVLNTSVYDILGKELKNIQLDSNRLDLSSLEDGMYILAIELDNGTTLTKRIAKQ